MQTARVIAEKTEEKNMKRTRKEKFQASIKRTAVAVLLIIIAVLYLGTAIHWKMWCPKDNWRVLMVLSMYAGGIVLLIYGVYLLSPIYIGTFVYILLDEICKKIRVSIRDKEELEEERKEEKEQLADRLIHDFYEVL